MEQENQTAPTVEKKSNKGLYAIIVIVIIILIGWGIKSMVRTAVSTVTGVNIDKSIGGSTTYSNSEGSVTVGTNKLPDNWPSDVPAYPGASIQYSGSSNPQTGEAGSAVSFLTKDSIQSVTDFYKKELAANGWTIEQTATIGQSTVISAKKDNRTFGVYMATGDGQVSVTASVVIPKTN